MRKWNGVALVVPMFAIAGCGALFNGGPASVTITSTPSESEVWIDGSLVGSTPVSVPLAKNRDHTVVFRKNGFREQSVTINRQLSAGYLILDVLGGLLPVIVDAATGSWYTLSTNSVNTNLVSASTQREGQLSREQLARLLSGEARFAEVVPLMDLVQ